MKYHIDKTNLQLIGFINKSSNFYNILGIECDCEKEDVKRAYRLLSIKVHPDKNNGSLEATEAFKKFNSAHECLTDEKKRLKYHNFLVEVSYL